MPSGPKPLPTAVLKARGSRRAKDRGNEPKPPPGVPSCPLWLDPEAKVVWAELSPKLAELGILSLFDTGAFASYCQAWAEFEIATRQLQAEGRTLKTDSGYMQPHPAVAMQRSAWAAIKAFSALFGLNASDRSRLRMEKKEPSKDGKAKYFRTVG